jgi:hypothetical protein
MTLDYAGRFIEVAFGSFDASFYLDGLQLEAPFVQLGDTLTWRGSFRVCCTRDALADGLEDEFDERLRPARWRPNQVPVAIKIDGHPLPKMRIEDYRYDRRTRTGEGRLWQIVDAVAGIRPPVDIAYVLDGEAITLTCNRLINEAFKKATNVPGKAISGVFGNFYGVLNSSDPIRDAQRLAATSWRWLTVSPSEQIVTTGGYSPSLFSRNSDEYELEPDKGNVNFQNTRVIVSGAYQTPDLRPNDCPTNANGSLDRNGRPERQATQEKRPFSVVFPPSRGEAGNDATLIVAEEKIVLYQYPDSQNQYLIGELAGTNGIVGMEIQRIYSLYQNDPTADKTKPCQTIVIKRQPAGRLFESLGKDTTLVVAEVTIEAKERKAVYAPFGVVFPPPKPKQGEAIDSATNFGLIAKTIEDLTTQVIPDNNHHGGAIDERTGQPICFDRREVEPPQIRPLRKLRTITVKAEAAIAPIGWKAIVPNPLTLDLGWLPDGASADKLARELAAQIHRRRSAMKVTMPIPNEWLVAGCPPTGRCTLDGDDWELEAISISADSQRLVFEFRGNPFTYGGLPIWTVDLGEIISASGSSAIVRAAISTTHAFGTIVAEVSASNSSGEITYHHPVVVEVTGETGTNADSAYTPPLDIGVVIATTGTSAEISPPLELGEIIATTGTGAETIFYPSLDLGILVGGTIATAEVTAYPSLDLGVLTGGSSVVVELTFYPSLDFGVLLAATGTEAEVTAYPSLDFGLLTGGSSTTVELTYYPSLDFGVLLAVAGTEAEVTAYSSIDFGALTAESGTAAEIAYYSSIDFGTLTAESGTTAEIVSYASLDFGTLIGESGTIADVLAYPLLDLGVLVGESGTVAVATYQVTYQSLVATDGATNYWNLGAASGAPGTIVASIGSINGTRVGTAQTNASIFNGTNNLVDFVMTHPLTNYSYEIWFKTTANPGNTRPISYVNNGPSYNDRNLFLSIGNIAHRLWPAEQVIYSASQSFDNNNWHHAVVTVQSGVGQKIYVDGVLVASGNAGASNASAATKLTVGFGTIPPGFNGSSYFVGQIDRVALYTGAVLTLAQIQAHFNFGSP